MNSGLIMLTVLTTVAASEAKSVQETKGFKMQPVIAGFVLGLFLFTFDAAAPQVNKYITILILVTVLATNGHYLLALVPQKG